MDGIEGAGKQVVGIISAIIGLAVIAVVFSYGANTVNVVGTFFQGLTGLLGVVISPVTGSGAAAAAAGLSGSVVPGGSIYAGETSFPLVSGSFGYNGYGPNAALNTANQALGVVNNGINTAATGANFVSGLSSSGAPVNQGSTDLVSGGFTPVSGGDGFVSPDTAFAYGG